MVGQGNLSSRPLEGKELEVQVMWAGVKTRLKSSVATEFTQQESWHKNIPYHCDN